MSKGKKILKWFAFAGFFLETFFLFLYWTFPYEYVRDWVVHEVEYPKDQRGNRKPSGWKLEMLSFEPSWFTGVELEGVQISKLSTDNEEQTPGFVYLPRVSARVSLISLLFGDPEISFSAELAGGEVEGEYQQRKSGLYLDVQLQNVNLRQVAILRSLSGIPAFGIANINLHWDMNDNPKTAKGKIEGEIKGFALGDGKSQIKLPGMDAGLTLEKMDLGTLQIMAEAEKGIFNVELLQADGKHLALQGKGDIKLNKELMRSTLDLLIRVEVKKAYRDLNLKTQGLSMLLDTSPQLAPARTTDKALQYRLTGSIKSPRAKGARRETFSLPTKKKETGDQKNQKLKE